MVMIVSMLIMEYCASQINPIAIAIVNSTFGLFLLRLISHFLNFYSGKNNKKSCYLILLLNIISNIMCNLCKYNI